MRPGRLELRSRSVRPDRAWSCDELLKWPEQRVLGSP